MTPSLNGTHWKCTDTDMRECGMTATIIDGEINPKQNGDQDIEIQYQNGETATMELKSFQSRFKRIIQPPPQNVVYIRKQPHFGLRGGQ